MGAMTVRVRLFAILRERAGRDSLEIELDELAHADKTSSSTMLTPKEKGERRC